MLALGGTITGILVCCMNKAEGTAGLVVFAVFVGFWSGTIISGGSAAITICVDDMRNLGTYSGMGMAVASLAALMGPPATGAMVETYGSFFQATLFSGLMCIVGGIIALLSKTATPNGLFGRV